VGAADLLDVLLAAALVWAAWRALATREPASGVLLYVVFGLLAALVWFRLEAPDVALAEAAIGAGLTGALLLEAVARRRRRVVARLRFRPLLAACCTGLGALLVAVVLVLPDAEPGLAPAVADELERAAADHPVTAVLLDFRAYDTLLEVAVLLVAALALLAVARSDDVAGRSPAPRREAQVAWTARVAVPVVVLVAAYLLVLGTTAPGGAFQAGAVLAAGAVLLRLAGYGLAPLLRGPVLRLLLVSGFAVFLAVGIGAAAAEGALLDYPEPWGGRLVLLVEAAITLAVAAALAALFVGAGARSTGGREE
jgi:multisubunit Na+/H+ antiporter MnhB subunit